MMTCLNIGLRGRQLLVTEGKAPKKCNIYFHLVCCLMMRVNFLSFFPWTDSNLKLCTYDAGVEFFPLVLLIFLCPCLINKTWFWPSLKAKMVRPKGEKNLKISDYYYREKKIFNSRSIHFYPYPTNTLLIFVSILLIQHQTKTYDLRVLLHCC